VSRERGSAALLLIAVACVVLVLTIGVADAGIALAGRLRAAAADAAALAAAPVTFRPFGASGSPTDEARRLAVANGSALVSCRCPIDRTWLPRTVEVVVERRVALLGIGSIGVRAASRAEFAPLLLLE
jgi:hypothetical protein